MRTTLNRAIVFALYQLTLFAGILLLPLALVMRKAGISLPVHRAVSRVNETYEEVETDTAR
ncbi:hypothetical protein I7X12_18390 [Halosimplex litoreum]|uniref:Uncharacterized protein n=1 Tax=Halosimplex litoreum TaxID=1198301 RepID=A0A7T3FXX0_9EURY|nr:hypothetical protein [Halosimplex litoreum]QPV62671.1 hypothetical protein I7X12_18390 [Halosimplex litoreum]